MTAKDFMLKFEGRLWTQGKDHSVHPLIDIASMNASGALLWNAMKRILQLVSPMRFSASWSKRDPSNPTDELIFKLEPTASFTRHNQEIPSHWLLGSIECPSLTHRANLEVGFSVIDQTPDFSLSDSLSGHKNAVGQALDSESHLAPRTGNHQVLFSPQQADDDLRASGVAIALACNNNIGRLVNCETISRWICRISLATDEGSVSNLTLPCYFSR